MCFEFVIEKVDQSLNHNKKLTSAYIYRTHCDSFVQLREEHEKSHVSTTKLYFLWADNKYSQLI